jgi:hypothetical protein
MLPMLCVRRTGAFRAGLVGLANVKSSFASSATDHPKFSIK